jgi:hypothetical protein
VVLVGPVPAMPVSPRFRPLMVSSERRGTLCDGTLHLQLMLSEVPDRSWVEAFCQWDRSKSPFTGVAAGHLPRIEDDQIYWSIRQADLASAWWYLGRCVDRANAACSRLTATRAQLESCQANEHARYAESNERSVPRITRTSGNAR